MKNINKEKFIKNGCVAIVIAPNYGSGFSTCYSNDNTGCEKDPVIAELVLEREEYIDKTFKNYNWEKDEKIIEIDQKIINHCKNKYGSDFFIHDWGSKGLNFRIEWVSEGYSYRITEHDGKESIEVDCTDWKIA